MEVGTGTGWNKLNSGGIPSALGLSMAGDIGFDHISLSSHVSNDVVINWGDIMGWEKDDLGEIFGMGSFGTEVHLGTDDTLSTSGRRSVENETVPSPASAESPISSHMDAQHSFPEDLQNGFELGNPNLWMTETDSKLDMNIDPAGLDMMELLAGLPTPFKVDKPSSHASLQENITLDSEFSQKFLQSKPENPPQPPASHNRPRPRSRRSQRAPVKNGAPRPTYQFVCGINGCTRSYKRRYELLRHQKIHSGVKIHACGYSMCDRGGTNGFARKDHLQQHLRQVHGVSN